MKFIMLGLLALTLSAESFAQHRRNGGGRGGPVVTGPRYNPPGGGRYDNRGRNDWNDHRNDYRTGPIGGGYRRGPVVIHRQHSYRTYRDYRRTPVIWSYGFGYTCDYTSTLRLNGSYLHDFFASYDCSQALSDIRIYGDFCDGGDLYDQTGYREASFSSSYECREALGYFY